MQYYCVLLLVCGDVCGGVVWCGVVWLVGVALARCCRWAVQNSTFRTIQQTKSQRRAPIQQTTANVQM
mgnify:CR=1 FL=1